ncbi:hypothetical protein B484DRAFT_465998, partial [Ochromonadaceae sp. CCMP2298]
MSKSVKPAEPSNSTAQVIVLESGDVMPYEFKDWVDATSTAFKTAKLYEFLTGEKSSKFSRILPKFEWELEVEGWARDPQAETSSTSTFAFRDLRDSLGLETGNTQPYSFAQSVRETIGLGETPVKARGDTGEEERPKKSETTSSDRPGYKRVVTYRSPGIEDEDLAQVLILAHSREFYFARAEAFDRKRSQHERDERVFDEDVTKGMEKLMSVISPAVKELVAPAIDSRDLARIWADIYVHCGTKTGREGLAALQLQWATLNISIDPRETMSAFLARMEKLARGFNAYAPRWHKDDESLMVQLRLALQADTVNWREWLFEIRDAERLRENYGQLRSRLIATAANLRCDIAGKGPGPKPAKLSNTERSASEKALAATPAGRSLVQRTRNDERKKIADAPPIETQRGAAARPTGKPASVPKTSTAEAAVLGKPLCFGCGLRGHINADCSWRTQFDKLRAECKQQQVAGAAVGAGDESDDETACAAHEVVSAQPDADAGEPFEDWLSASLIAENSSAPAVETCLAMIARDKLTIMDSGCTSSSTGALENPLESFTPKIEFISLGNADFKVRSEGRGRLGPLSNVMWTPTMSFSMVSVSSLDLEGKVTVFGASKCVVLSAEHSKVILDVIAALPLSATLMSATLTNKLYHVDGDLRDQCGAADEHLAETGVGDEVPGFLSTGPLNRNPGPASPGTVTVPTVVPYTFLANRRQILGSHGTTRPGSTAGLNPLQLLHLRTGHSSKAVLLAGLKINAFLGAQTTFEAARKLEIGPCDACLRGDERAAAMKSSFRDLDTLLPMQEVGFDPVRLSTVVIGGYEYMNCGHDYGSRLAMGYPAKTEGNQVATIQEAQREWCLPYGHKISKLHTDHASIFLSRE